MELAAFGGGQPQARDADDRYQYGFYDRELDLSGTDRPAREVAITLTFPAALQNGERDRFHDGGITLQ